MAIQVVVTLISFSFTILLFENFGQSPSLKEYIENQLKVDKEADQLSIFDPNDPFKGGK